MRLVLLTYNILDGGRGRETQLTEIITAQDADVILLQEVMDEQFIRELAARLQTEYYIAESNSPRHSAFLSRLSIRDAFSFHPRVLRHGMLHATLEYAAGQTLDIFGIHLAAPAYTFLVEMYRVRELNLILPKIADTRADKIILAGDFNSIAPGDAMNLNGVAWHVRASIILQGGLVARQVIGHLRGRKWNDCYRVLHPHKNGFTLPPDPPRVRLDYFFVNNALYPNLYACDVVTAPDAVKFASDHLPVRMELQM